MDDPGKMKLFLLLSAPSVLTFGKPVAPVGWSSPSVLVCALKSSRCGSVVMLV